jgi:hypothetical protein
MPTKSKASAAPAADATEAKPLPQTVEIFGLPGEASKMWLDANAQLMGNWMEWQRSLWQPWLDWQGAAAQQLGGPLLARAIEPWVTRGGEHLG